MKRKAIGVTAVCGVLVMASFAVFVRMDSAPPAPTPVEGAQSVVAPAIELSDSALETVTPSAPSARVMVEVQGAVAAPGVYDFPANARVHEALERAGGPLADAEIRDLNIAAILMDGSVLSVPWQQRNPHHRQPAAADLNPPAYTRSGWFGEGASTPATGELKPAPAAPPAINLNTATQAELETLPGVGEKTAEKIIRFRESQAFAQVEDLQYIQGIGEKRMEALRPLVTVK